MTETLEPVTDDVDQQRLAEQLLAQAKERCFARRAERHSAGTDGGQLSRRESPRLCRLWGALPRHLRIGRCVAAWVSTRAR